MNTAKEHYDQHLAAVYSWMAGSPETVLERNRALFRRIQIHKAPRGLAVDLGSGSGFQSIPLAEFGFSVVAVDFSSTLLAELRKSVGSLSIRTVEDDLLNFSKHIDEPAQVVVCMGDTLTHLESSDAVQSLLLDVGRMLVKDGVLVLTFRDYVTVEPQGTRRFIPVRSDESKILTCFLEYHKEVVEVYDLLYQKEGEQWVLNASSYPKLRLNKEWVSERLGEIGLTVLSNDLANGMVSIVARKD
jgi:SAM-dependent methyltransferase